MRQRKAIGGRRLSATAAVDMKLEVLDPWEHVSYGCEPLIKCIDHTKNHNSHAPVFRFDASGKGADGQWWAMVDVIGRWMRIGGLALHDGGRSKL